MCFGEVERVIALPRVTCRSRPAAIEMRFLLRGAVDWKGLIQGYHGRCKEKPVLYRSARFGFGSSDMRFARRMSRKVGLVPHR